MTARELARVADRILQTKKFRDYPGARNGLQVGHSKPVKKIGWAVDADLESIRRAGMEKVDFLVVHHGIFWGDSALDRKIRGRRVREARRLGVAVYSSHLPLDAHPEIGNSTGLLRALGLEKSKRRPFGKAMGREIGWKVALLRSGHAKRVGSFEGLGGRWKRGELVRRCRCLTGGKVALLRSGHAKRVGSFEGLGGIRIREWKENGTVKVIPAGPDICRKIGVVTGGFGDLDQVVKAGLDTLITGEVDYPTEVKARELGINLILAGHHETETFGVEALAGQLRSVIGNRWSEVGRRRKDAEGQKTEAGGPQKTGVD